MRLGSLEPRIVTEEFTEDAGRSEDHSALISICPCRVAVMLP